MIRILICLLPVLILMFVVSCRSCNGEKFTQPKPLTEAEEMELLIERLANVYRKPITLGADAVVYQPKKDETVRDEIKAKGRKIIPYLIKGMNHPNREVGLYCVALLSQIPFPSKAGLAALVEKVNSFPLDSQDHDFPYWVYYSLYQLTGMGEVVPPSKNTRWDIQAMKDLWLPWWETNKDKLVDTDTGIGLKNDDGTITPLPLRKP